MGIPAISHPPRILMLYGSVRERSYSRLATEEAGRLLTAMGADVRIFNPSGLPLPDDAPESHPKVMELRELVRWHCCKVSDEAAFCLIQRPYISKTLLTRRISPRGSP